MSKAMAKTKKTPAQTDMSGFYLGASSNRRTTFACDRNLVITYANSTAKRTPQPLESEIKKCCRSLTSIRWWEPIDEFHLDPSKQRRILADPGTCRTRRIFRSAR